MQAIINTGLTIITIIIEWAQQVVRIVATALDRSLARQQVGRTLFLSQQVFGLLKSFCRLRSPVQMQETLMLGHSFIRYPLPEVWYDHSLFSAETMLEVRPKGKNEQS
jgi:hypothetical protein